MRIFNQSLVCYFCASIVLWLSSSPQAGAQDDNSSIIIGQSADLSGPLSKLTLPYLSGANAYFDYVNAQGGVYARKISLVTLDDRNDPELAAKNTNTLLNRQNLVALFGYGGAKTSVAALSIIDKKTIPFIAPITGSKIIFGGFNRNVFTVRASYNREYEHLFAQFSRMGLKKFAVFHDNTGIFHLPLLPTMIENASAELVASESNGGKNMKEIAEVFLREKPDVILIMNSSPKLNSALVRELRAKAYLGYFYCASLVCSPILTDDLKAEGSGFIISQVVPAPWKVTPPIVNEYRKILEKSKTNEVSYLGLEGYIAAKILVEGLKRAGPNLTRERLILSLESINEKSYPIPGFKINFSNTNHHGSTFVDITTVNKEGRVVY